MYLFGLPESESFQLGDVSHDIRFLLEFLDSYVFLIFITILFSVFFSVTIPMCNLYYALFTFFLLLLFENKLLKNEKN